MYTLLVIPVLRTEQKKGKQRKIEKWEQERIKTQNKTEHKQTRSENNIYYKERFWYEGYTNTISLFRLTLRKGFKLEICNTHKTTKNKLSRLTLKKGFDFKERIRYWDC